MRLYNKIFAILLFLGISIGCSDEYLVESPPHIMAADVLYVDLAGFEAGINGLYAQFRRERGGETSPTTSNDLMIDPAISGTDNCYGNHRSGWARIGNDWGTRNVPTDGHYR